MSHNLLIVEDNADIARLVAIHARDIDCEVDIASDGRRALELYRERDYDLVILDLMLPGLDGLDVCRELRAQPRYVPILMLTSKSSELDRVLGLEVGADDYLTKPFSIPELKARLKAQFRRSSAQLKQNAPHEGRIVCGGLCIDTATRQVRVDEREVTLTAREFDLLAHFAGHPGRVYSRLQLLEQVWGYQYEGYEHTVNSHINRLRAKIETDPAKPRYILTVWGVGYRFGEASP
jgi:DNA-binding response OmpR family regulator